MSATSTGQDLIQRRAALLAAEPHLRARDIAARLGISEAELLALGSETATVTRLRPEWPQIIAAVPALGRVMALTRNDSVVHERKGIYGALEGGSHVGLIVGEDIDLRIFFTHWKSGFGVSERLKEGGTRRSLQFFDAQGVAIHKIYETDKSDAAAFDALIAQFATDHSPLGIAPAPERNKPLADSEIDVTGFRAAWDAMKDTHEFHGLITKFRVERLQGLRLAGETRAARVPAHSLRATLESARDRNVPIMVFVGNPGCIQIHTGPVKRVERIGPWINVLDPDFSLHLREDLVAQVWLVKKPTADGVVTSIELFDAQGEFIAYFFGKRKPGIPETTGWRMLAESMETR